MIGSTKITQPLVLLQECQLGVVPQACRAPKAYIRTRSNSISTCENERYICTSQSLRSSNRTYLLYQFLPPHHLLLSIPLVPILCCTTSYTSSGLPVADTFSTLPSSSKWSTTGMLVSSKVLNRFLMLFSLSSDRPDVLPRFRSRFSMTSSGQSKKRVNLEGQTASSNLRAWSILRGKPARGLVRVRVR